MIDTETVVMQVRPRWWFRFVTRHIALLPRRWRWPVMAWAVEHGFTAQPKTVYRVRRGADDGL